ncbi:MAG: hypothetical protein PUP92_19010 [Rhizonema sp. PD38]|nr:hypothetical protein [Rhizonema sp. PD38]
MIEQLTAQWLKWTYFCTVLRLGDRNLLNKNKAAIAVLPVASKIVDSLKQQS